MGREIAHRYLGELESVAGSDRAGFLSVLQGKLQGNQTQNVHSTVTPPQAAQNGNTPNSDQNEPADPTHVLFLSSNQNNGEKP